MLIINNYDMPESCYDCVCNNDYFQCNALDNQSLYESNADPATTRLPGCPLKEFGTCETCALSRETLIVPEDLYCNSMDAYVPKDFFCGEWEKE